MKNTTENNKLIAEFMMFETVGDLHLIPFDNTANDTYLPEHMKFHSSWDWLMPVVEKCFHTMGGNDINQVHHERIMDGLMEINITHTYERLVEFIKWYNENN